MSKNFICVASEKFQRILLKYITKTFFKRLNKYFKNMKMLSKISLECFDNNKKKHHKNIFKTFYYDLLECKILFLNII